MMLPNLTISTGLGDYLHDTDDNRYFDLCMGYGSVCFGHRHAGITDRIKQQIESFVSPGFLETIGKGETSRLLQSLVPSTHHVFSVFSTGMEAVEASLRLCQNVNHRPKILGFQNAMHGKSTLTSSLAGRTSLALNDQVTSIPYIDQNDAALVLAHAQRLLHTREYAALIIEPIQMSSNGLRASNEFYRELHQACVKTGTLLIFDEILSGFYRCGSGFFFQQLDFTPDIILAGKALGNGLPTSVVFINSAIDTSALNYRPASTYSFHPLTCAAINASIEVSQQINLVEKITQIEQTVRRHLPAERLFGSGAMWCYKTIAADSVVSVFQSLLNERIVVSFFPGYIRLLPSYFIDQDALGRACDILLATDENLA